MFLALHIFLGNRIHDETLRGFIQLVCQVPYVAIFSVCTSVFWGYGRDLQSFKFPAHKPTNLRSSCHISQLLVIPSSPSLSSLNPTSNSLLSRLSIPGSFGLPGTSSSRRPSSSSSSPSRLSPLNLLLPCEIDGRRSQEGICERKYVEEWWRARSR